MFREVLVGKARIAGNVMQILKAQGKETEYWRVFEARQNCRIAIRKIDLDHPDSSQFAHDAILNHTGSFNVEI